MMESLVLARVTATGRHYLRNVHYHRIGSDGRFQTQLDPTKGDLLREAFGVDPELFERALITL